ncbi:hypothetical protein JCGZ_12724 [Jatropha curcas]|uniref:Uncharacterized protein n=1 Tax=Jatropha curcas TaxID=180498 RepID=A0A067KAQ6_JATCU|nr:hypothetical protein JCGZ_12724 [Jatropha curcas]
MHGGDGGGPATLRRGFKRQNALLFARFTEMKSDFRSDEVDHQGFVRPLPYMDPDYDYRYRYIPLLLYGS